MPAIKNTAICLTQLKASLDKLALTLPHLNMKQLKNMLKYLADICEKHGSLVFDLMKPWGFVLLSRTDLGSITAAFTVLRDSWTPKDDACDLGEIETFLDLVDPLLTREFCAFRENPIMFMNSLLPQCSALLSALLRRPLMMANICQIAYHDTCEQAHTSAFKLLIFCCLTKRSDFLNSLVKDFGIVGQLALHLKQAPHQKQGKVTVILLSALRTAVRMSDDSLFTFLATAVKNFKIPALLKKISLQQPKAEEFKAILCTDFEGPAETIVLTCLCHDCQPADQAACRDDSAAAL